MFCRLLLGLYFQVGMRMSTMLGRHDAILCIYSPTPVGRQPLMKLGGQNKPRYGDGTLFVLAVHLL